MEALFILHPNEDYAEFQCKEKICDSRTTLEAWVEIKINKGLNLLNKRLETISPIVYHEFQAHSITLEKFEIFDFKEDILPKFKEIMEWYFNQKINITISDRRKNKPLSPDNDF